jgi:uncharacterized damage-inducible protein DinB
MDSLNAPEAARAATLRLVASLNQAQLDFSPRQGQWSAGEVLDHLLLAEAMYRDDIARLIAMKRAGQRPYLRRTFADVNVSPFYLPDVVLPLLTLPLTIANVFMPAFVRDLAIEYAVIPTRNPDRTTPRARRAAAALRAELLTSQAYLRELLSANADLDFTEMVSEHPLTGPNDVPAMLAFLARHERRHQGQIARLKAHPRFPPL